MIYKIIISIVTQIILIVWIVYYFLFVFIVKTINLNYFQLIMTANIYACSTYTCIQRPESFYVNEAQINLLPQKRYAKNIFYNHIYTICFYMCNSFAIRFNIYILFEHCVGILIPFCLPLLYYWLLFHYVKHLNTHNAYNIIY